MFDLQPEEARLLLNVALMAAGANRYRSAAKIFAVLEQFRPQAPEVAVGKAIALINAMQFDACVSYIDGEALRRFPLNAMLLAFKGMALIRLGRAQDALEPLAVAAGQKKDPAAAQLAADLYHDIGGDK